MDLMTHSSSDIEREIASLKADVKALGENVEIQGQVQLEIAKLLQHFHQQQQALPQQVGEVVKRAFDGLDWGKIAVTQDAVSKLDSRLTQLLVNSITTKQAANMTLRRLGPATEKIRAVFIVQSIPMWDALADVYWEMTKDDRFHPTVVSIDHRHLGRAEFAGEDDVHKGLTGQNIPHLRLNVPPLEALDILRNLQPDVVFRQQQWDSPVPAGMRTPELTFARICVVPYGMGHLANLKAKSEREEASPSNYDQEHHRMAWRVFCETEVTRSYFKSFMHCDPDKLILSGYPKLDRLLAEKGKGEWPIPEPKGRTFRVIWAPHHSLAVRGSGFGVFHRIHRQMLDWARTSGDIQFVFKPHPALSYAARNTPGLSAGDYDAFCAAWSALPNCTICEGDYGKLFDASDIMLTDGVAFLTEYHLFGKPLIFFDSGVHPPFDAIGRLGERCAHRVKSFGDMQTATLAYKNGKAWEREEERRELLRVIMPHQGKAARIIVDSIADGLGVSRKTSQAIG